jgi:SAM-dependent methyltransferase
MVIRFIAMESQASRAPAPDQEHAKAPLDHTARGPHHPAALNKYSSFRWDIGFLAENQAVRSKDFGMTREAKSVKFPIRLLRYWFGYQLLREDCRRAGRPLDVVEIGVHVGQMLEFVHSAPPGADYRRWTAVDAIMRRDRLAQAGYTDFFEANLEDPKFALPQDYDTAILLHVLEHLFEPEEVLKKIAASIRPGGALIGGFPVVPGPLAAIRQSQVRRTAMPMGHVSVFSPGRVRQMAAQAGLVVEFMSGAFLMRSKGSALENSAAWMRINLLWGQLFPGWPGEIYWLMRKPA